MHSSDLDLKGSRQLPAHHTNETIAPLDDDVASVVSCATTETWGIRSVRRPRHRHKRRSKRRARLLEQDALVRVMCESGEAELEYETTGRLPFAAFGPLAACFEASDEEESLVRYGIPLRVMMMKLLMDPVTNGLWRLAMRLRFQRGSASLMKWSSVFLIGVWLKIRIHGCLMRILLMRTSTHVDTLVENRS